MKPQPISLSALRTPILDARIADFVSFEAILYGPAPADAQTQNQCKTVLRRHEALREGIADASKPPHRDTGASRVQVSSISERL